MSSQPTRQGQHQYPLPNDVHVAASSVVERSVQTYGFGGLPFPQPIADGSALQMHVDGLFGLLLSHGPYVHAPHACETPQTVAVVLQYMKLLPAHGFGVQQAPLVHVAFGPYCEVQSSHVLLIAHAVAAVPG
jgi:hypothetical protein